jgi:hypothetical protein
MQKKLLSSILGVFLLAGCNFDNKTENSGKYVKISGMRDEIQVYFDLDLSSSSNNEITVVRTGVKPSGPFTNSIAYAPTNNEYRVLRDIFDKLN